MKTGCAFLPQNFFTAFKVGLTLLAACALMGSVPPAAAEDAGPAYRRPDVPLEERLRDLLGRMTLEEKARQLDMYSGGKDLLDESEKTDSTHAKDGASFDIQKAQATFGTLGVGAIHDLYPDASLYNSLQKWVMQSSRLGIPALFLEEGLHGYMGKGQTIFPQSVNLAATWSPALAQETGAAIAAETRAHGVDMILGPVLDVARDPRWGRVEEDFGEDPFLTGQLGLAYVRGMQGDSLASDHNVISEPKHFAGHGSPEGGLNTSPVHAGEREVRSVMLKSFEPAVRDGGALGIMVAYHDIDGVPCAANPWLLQTVLREEWGFKGFVLADLGAIRRLYEDHHVADSPREAVCQALNAGVDMQFYDFDHAVFQGAILEGVKQGRISPETLDRAVSRILRVKFLLGLFDHPFVDERLDSKVRRVPAHLNLSLEVARQSMCLLKNDNGLLPLKKDLKRIAVIGTNASVARLGDYTVEDSERHPASLLDEIKAQAGAQTEILYCDGENLQAAVAMAKKAEVVILGLGEWTGVSGEWFDRSELGLPGRQESLLEAVTRTGIPTVLVLQNGRALAIPWAAEHVPAILEAWYPGEFGGRAIAETLFGDNNPAGRLPVSFPRSVGQLPVFYNHFPSRTTKYVEGRDAPLFVFGQGLSYTTFKYDGLAVAPAAADGGDLTVSFRLTNSGSRAGDEVAQLYVRQTTASVATPVKALKGFSRIHLQAGESRQVSFRLKRSDLAIWGAAQTWRTKPGEYTVTVGGSSAEGLAAKFVLP